MSLNDILNAANTLNNGVSGVELGSAAANAVNKGKKVVSKLAYIALIVFLQLMNVLLALSCYAAGQGSKWHTVGCWFILLNFVFTFLCIRKIKGPKVKYDKYRNVTANSNPNIVADVNATEIPTREEALRPSSYKLENKPQIDTLDTFKNAARR